MDGYVWNKRNDLHFKIEESDKMISGRASYKVDEDGLRIIGVFDGRYKEISCKVLPYGFVNLGARKDIDRLKYVVSVEDSDLKSITGQRVIRFETEKPAQVAYLRDDLEKRGYVTYECDLKFIRRLLIDKVLKVKYDGVSYIDIEVDDSKGVPNEHGKYEILCIGLDDNWLWRGDYDTEQEMLRDFIDLLEKERIGVLAGWNVEFDYYHLLKRCEYLGVSYGRLAFTEKIDILNRYRFAIKGLESYSLDEVAKHEGIGGKVSIKKKVSEMSKDELFKYNMRDVELVREIDERYGFSEVRLELANYCNLLLEMCTPIQLADTLVLRRLRELGYVAPNVKVVEKRDYIGAFVDARRFGVVDNIVYLDFVALYPNIIVNENIDIDGFNGEVYPHIVKKLMEQRERHRRKWKETGDKKEKTMQEMLKPVINSFYGSLGNSYFRWCDFDKAERVTLKGREIIQKADKFLQENGFEVVYLDTDGMMVSVGESVNEVVAESLAKLLNSYIKPYKVKVEEVIEKMIFFKSGDSAAKKRYWGRTIDGREIIRGVEVRRGDWCRLAKDVQRDLINMIFNEASDSELLKYLSNVRKDLYNGKYDSKLVIVKGFKKKDEYKNLNLPHLRALAKARDAFIDGKVRFVYANGDVEPVVNESDLKRYRIDYDYYWKGQVVAVASRIFESIGVDGVITGNGVYRQVKLC